MATKYIGNPWFCYLPKKVRWTVHNCIAHPLSEILYLIGFEKLSDSIHDKTIPYHEQGTGRG